MYLPSLSLLRVYVEAVQRIRSLDNAVGTPVIRGVLISSYLAALCVLRAGK